MWHVISGDSIWYSSKSKEKVVQYWKKLVGVQLQQLTEEQKVPVIIDGQSLAQIPGMSKHPNWINGD